MFKDLCAGGRAGECLAALGLHAQRAEQECYPKEMFHSAICVREVRDVLFDEYLHSVDDVYASVAGFVHLDARHGIDVGSLQVEGHCLDARRVVGIRVVLQFVHDAVCGE